MYVNLEMQNGFFPQRQQRFIPLHFQRRDDTFLPSHISRSLLGDETSKIRDMSDDDEEKDVSNASGNGHDDDGFHAENQDI